MIKVPLVRALVMENKVTVLRVEWLMVSGRDVAQHYACHHLILPSLHVEVVLPKCSKIVMTGVIRLTHVSVDQLRIFTAGVICLTHVSVDQLPVDQLAL